jgi:hypothetical protein
MGATIPLQPTFDSCYQQPIRPPHSFPVVLIRRSTSQAYLVMAAVIADARPRESMRATSLQKLF